MIILYSKSMHLFVGSRFLVSHRGLRKPRYFYGLSLLGTMSGHIWQVFHPRGDLSLLADTRHIFSLSCINRVPLLDVVPFNRAHPIKHQTQCRFINHQLNPYNAMSRCICNAICYCLFVPGHIYDECYMENFIKHSYH